MYHSLHLGKIAGISLEINASWLIILVLLTVSLALGWFPAAVPGLPQGAYWGLGLIAAVLLFVSVLAHELAHSLVANARGLPVKSITLFIFGGVSNLEKEPRTPGSEFQITIVGPLTSLVIAVICWFIHNALLGVSLPAAAVFGYLAITNALLTVFNLIPGFPLDGGRLLRSILWKATGNLRTATRWATRVGQVIAWLFILAGIWLFFTGNFLDGLWLGFIGWFLLSSAQAASVQAQLEGSAWSHHRAISRTLLPALRAASGARCAGWAIDWPGEPDRYSPDTPRAVGADASWAGDGPTRAAACRRASPAAERCC